jgi:hypothetical protein
MTQGQINYQKSEGTLYIWSDKGPVTGNMLAFTCEAIIQSL